MENPNKKNVRKGKREKKQIKDEKEVNNVYITDRDRMVRCLFWVEELVSSILAYLRALLV